MRKTLAIICFVFFAIFSFAQVPETSETELVTEPAPSLTSEPLQETPPAPPPVRQSPRAQQSLPKRDALKLYNEGDYASAISVCTAELVQKPFNVESYVVMCWALVANGQYAEAEQRASDGLKISPHDLRLIEVFGEAKYYLGKNNGALEQFQKYVASAPQSASRLGTSYYFMGEIYIRQSRFQHAEDRKSVV